MVPWCVFPGDEPWRRDLFSSLPALEVLSLIGCDIPAGFFRLLHPADEESALCPRLKELTVADEYSLEDVIELARARKAGRVPLEKVLIRSNKIMQKRSVVAPLRELVGFVDYQPSGWKTRVCPF
jgi:hypothetical protein